jgi:hypothetical protein
MRRSLLVLLLTLNAGAASGQSLTGNDMLMIHQQEKGGRADILLGYIRAILESERFYRVTLEAAEERHPTSRALAITAHVRFCAPFSVSATQAYDVAMKHLNDNPAWRHKMGLLQVRDAFEAAWPCP